MSRKNDAKTCYKCTLSKKLDAKRKNNKIPKKLGYNRKGGARIPKECIKHPTKVRKDLRGNNGSLSHGKVTE